MSELSNLIKDVVASPLGDVIASVGRGVADAQQALDEGSLAKTLEIYSEGGAAAVQMLRDIGYSPTFYALPETIGEVRIALRLGNQQQNTPLPPQSAAGFLALNKAALTKAPKLYATPVDASYANRFGYQADISAKLTFKIVPVPAPAGVDEMRVLPDVTTAPLPEALVRLQSLDLAAELDPNIAEADYSKYVVSTQIPAFNNNRAVVVRQGDSIKLTLALQK